ncbi:MAG: B12-binding domain-containing radical SAM protein [Flavobacteriales bacterium]|nr:B12-binding domain-containing radical SAM protein [Flavobacteriales bacterium]
MSERLTICLVNAPVLAVVEPWYDQPDFGRTGLACLAAYLRENGFSNVSIIDAKFERLSFSACIDRIVEAKPDVVGYTAFTNEIKPAAYVAQKVKERLPQSMSIIGGVHITAIPERTMEEFPMFDVGVIGEGEETLLEIVQAVCNNLPTSEIRGTIFRTDSKSLKRGPVRQRILDQNTLPIPAWDLLPPAKTYFVQTMRGCPLNCVFCMNPNGRVARNRSVDLVIEELQYIVNKFHPKTISFGDELFSVDMPRAKSLIDAMASSGIGKQVNWDVQTHVRFVDDEIFQKFKEADVTRVEMGIETGDEIALKNMGKGTDLKMIETAFRLAEKHRVPFGTFFLIGQPNETVKSIIATIKLAVRMNPQLPMFGLMTPYPGTAVGKMAARGEGGYRLLSTDWDDYNKQIGGALEFTNISRWQLEVLQSAAYLSVYLFNWRFRDLMKFILEYRVGIYHVIRNLVWRQKTNPKKKPTDYDAITSGKGAVSKADMQDAYEHWSNYQKQSMVDLRKQRNAAKAS